MYNFGYVRVGAAVPKVNVADINHNTNAIIELIDDAKLQNVDLLVFPELSLTGYTCADLFFQDSLISSVHTALEKIKQSTIGCDMLIFVGAPLQMNSSTYNCAIGICNGSIIGIVPKTYIPNYNEFYEKRWFASGETLKKDTAISIDGKTVCIGTDVLFTHCKATIGVEICEDLWTPIPPSSIAALNGASIIVNLSATNELIGKHKYLTSLIKQQSARCRAVYVYSSAGFGESTTDLVFSGNAIIAENGELLCESKRFTADTRLEIADIDLERIRHDRIVANSFSDGSNLHQRDYRIVSTNVNTAKENTSLLRHINPHPFVPDNEELLNELCTEIISIQTEGLMKRVKITNTQNLVVGISGGLDSTLALLIAVNTFDKLGYSRSGIVGITMPGFGTTDRTYTNALTLMQQLGISIKEISIAKSVRQHFEDIEHSEAQHDVTYENSQARERTQILMDYANKINGLVVGTGDLSELALGWCTYNGDHMSMYAVNSSIPKTLVKYLVRWFALTSDNKELQNTLNDIIDTPISPELIPADEQGNIKQKTEDLVGPYEIHDFFLYNVLRNGYTPKKIYYLAKIAFSGTYDSETIKLWIRTFYRRFFNQQFKRSCMPDGPKVGSVCLSPRGDWRMPSDASSALWLSEIDEL